MRNWIFTFSWKTMCVHIP